MTQLSDLLSSLTLGGLRDLNAQVIAEIRARETDVSRAFKFGDRVKFTAKDGRTITGSVAKINLKTIKVRSIDTMWAVSPSLLSRVA